MTGTVPDILSLLREGDAPFALIAREGSPDVEILTGDVVDVDLLADIPLTGCRGHPPGGARARPLPAGARARLRRPRRRRAAAVPDRSRSHASAAWSAPSRCSPANPSPSSDAGFDIADDVYAGIVETVIADEIGRGEGANFVIRRDFTAGVDADPRVAALTWFRALLAHERGAYWTFAIVTPGHVAVGASPEAHVSARGGVVTMNPISGTFRHPAGGATAETLTEFLSSTKETEELFMVVDEELKMMSAVCTDGGRITGPHLKEMSRLTHTEYMLQRPEPPGSARHPARDDVRPDGHRFPHAERLHGDPAARALAPRLLLRRGRAVHAGRRRAAPRRRRVTRP